MTTFDPTATSAILANPRIDGAFEGAFGDYARALGARRPLVLLAFAPKSAGTFFRSAVIEAIDGQLGRIVHAEGGRDPVPYLPYLLSYFMGGVTADTLVTHVHMPASTANRHIIEAFDLKPIIMLRSIPDMLASFLDMLEKDPATPIGLSFLVPDDFAAMPPRKRWMRFGASAISSATIAHNADGAGSILRRPRSSASRTRCLTTASSRLGVRSCWRPVRLSLCAPPASALYLPLAWSGSWRWTSRPEIN
jgi:hypothetical protein